MSLFKKNRDDREAKEALEEELNRQVNIENEKKNAKEAKDINGVPKIVPHVYTGGIGFIKKNLGKLILALKIIGLVLIVEILFLTYYLGTNIKIFDGVSVNGIELGGLRKADACELLKEKLSKDVVDKDLTFYFDDYVRTYNIGDIIESLDYEKIARDAQRVGREGNLFHRFMTVIRAKRIDHEIDLKYTVDLTKLRSIIYEIKYDIDKETTDASYSKNLDGDFVITDEIYGINLDVAKTIDTFRSIIENDECREYDYKLQLIATKEEPKITREDIESFSTQLSRFETDYQRSNEDRVKKLDEACKKLNGYIIEADDTFSFNDILGITPTKESINEYSDSNDEVNVQLATTLYNCAILAGLEIVERTNVNSLPEYIEIGRDALVYGKGVDLKFKNTTTNKIYIEAFTNNGKCFVRLYGNENFKIYDSVTFKHNITKVNVSKEVITKDDETIEPGEKITMQVGKSGCTCEIEVIYKVAGREDKVVTLPVSEYEPTPTRINVGVVKKDITEISDGKYIDLEKNNNNDINTNNTNNKNDNNSSNDTQGKIIIGE